VLLAALAGPRLLAATTAAAGGLTVLTLVALARLGAERVVGQATLGGTTANSRRLIWTAALAMVRDHPWLGIGLDNFLYRYQLQYMLPEAWAEPNISHPHNWALQFWLDLGLLGLVAFLGLLASFFWLAFRLIRDTRRRAATSSALAACGPSPLLLGAVASMVGWLVHGAVDNSYFLVDQAFVFWWQLALVVIVSQAGRRDDAA